MIVELNFDTKKILRSRGLEDRAKAAVFLARRVALRADPYTPMQSGVLKNTATVSKSADGNTTLQYMQPYAHYQYNGKVMGPNVLTPNGWRSMAHTGGKYYTGADLSYQGAPMRGGQWIDRMMAAHKTDVQQDFAAYCNKGGRK